MRVRVSRAVRVLFGAAIGVAVAIPAAADVRAGVDSVVEPIGSYLEALEKAGRLAPEEATLERLQDILVAAEGDLVRGDARSATTALFGVVESPRFSPLSETPSYQNAELLLGRALVTARAYRSAARYLVRVLERGPQGAFFVPAVRLLVDVSLETREFEGILARIEAVKQPLPEDSRHEAAYLRGRAAFASGNDARAATSLREVGKRSRLYPAALYFQGLIAAKQSRFDEARKAFCEVADQKDQDRVSFNVDRRFFRLKDLSRLALGRIAHERDRYDEAYYYYFSIPDDSDRLPPALFEAAWSMLQKGEFQAARAFADQMDRMFPTSPLRPELTILRADLAVKTCAFSSARAEADALVKRYRPLHDLARRALQDEGLRVALIGRLIESGGRISDASDVEGRLLAILILDPEFGELVEAAADAEVDLAEATRGVRLWRELGARARAATRDVKAATSPDAVLLLEDTVSLANMAGSQPRLAAEASELVLEASLLAYPPVEAGPYEKEARTAAELAREVARARADMLEAARQIGLAALVQAEARLASILGQARLVHIDAVVGTKKKLELEIGGLMEGRIPADVYRKLAVEGAIGDDEIYWPFEGEFWADEYENYR